MKEAKAFLCPTHNSDLTLKTSGKSADLMADLALVNCIVRTMNPSQPTAEAIAIRRDRVIKVGSNDEVKQFAGNITRIVDLQGKTVIPGFIDTHIHVADFGRFLLWLDLRGTGSITDLQRHLKERAEKTPVGKWIVGRGWNQVYFKEKRLPTLSDLDTVSPKNPVILYHESEKICVVNSKVLHLADITHFAASSSVDKDTKTGEPTGILRDSATDLVWKKVPEPTEDEILDSVIQACRKISEAGITSVHWLVLSLKEISIIEKLHLRRRLPIRVYVIIPTSLLDTISNFKSRDPLVLRIGAAMFSIDEYLASKTAALYQPYTGEPEDRGRLLCGQDEAKEHISRILRAGLQPVIHAMGDKAVDTALISLERTFKDTPNVHCRIEHAALLDESLIERLRKQRAIVSVQPLVMASEFLVWSAIERLGAKRARWLYPLKTLLISGIRVIAGSDCPMEPLNPLLGIQEAVSRNYFSEERISVEEALRMYTVDAAYSSSEENIKGAIDEGKLADLTVLSRDPLAVAPNEISSITVEMTIMAGCIIFPKHEFRSKN
jgi:predicted amidohydrolase YtcJ